MNKILIATAILLSVLGTTSVSAQFNIKLPDIKIIKTDKTGKNNNNNNGRDKNNEQNKEQNKETNNEVNGKSRRNDAGMELLYKQTLPTNVPVFLKNSIQIGTHVINEYWKAPNQSNYTSWVPKIRFDQFYDNETKLYYTVEYTNPDGSPWFSEKLDSFSSSAERTILYQSPNPYETGVIKTKSTVGTGMYGFKIINQDTKQVLYQGKFKVGKFNLGSRPDEKNNLDFYVEHDWILPFAEFGFHHAINEVGAMRAQVSIWLKGAVDSKELEGKVFYQGREIAATKDQDGGEVSKVEDRSTELAEAYGQDKIWRRWQFSWENFRFNNNGTFNPDYYPRAHFADKNPGEYTIKFYRNGSPIREINVTVGADGRFVVPAYSSQIPLPYHRIILPVKFTGGTEKWDAQAWKTESFYGNPLSGFIAR